MVEQISVFSQDLQGLDVQFDENLAQLHTDLHVQLQSVNILPNDYNPPKYSAANGNVTADVDTQNTESTVSS